MVINSGSSSLKFQLLAKGNLEIVAKGIFERIGLSQSSYTIRYREQTITKSIQLNSHEEAVRELVRVLSDYTIVFNLEDIKGIGHRIAHGGEIFKEAVTITDTIESLIEELSELAPLHNPINLMGIRAFKKYLPSCHQVAVFDTSFHQTLDAVHSIYPIPKEYCQRYGIRRYGFHGINHQYISEYVATHYSSSRKMIVAHLGNGSSLCAIKDGISYMTSMGFTPTAGLIMGTRSGDLDPAILPFLQKHEGLDSDGLEEILNQKSGLLGVSGLSSDMRDIEEATINGNPEAGLALDVYVHKIYSYIGSYIAELNGLDTLIFTAGIGEHSSLIRERVCAQLGFLGLEIDDKSNQVNAEVISTSTSSVRVLVVPANEELFIAQQVQGLLY